MQIIEANNLLEKILSDVFIINNSNVSVLSDFMKVWTDHAENNGVLLSSAEKWFKKVVQIHSKGEINRGIHLAAILLLDNVIRNVNLSVVSVFDTVLQWFLFIDKITKSLYLLNLDNDISLENDIILSFFRLHHKMTTIDCGVQFIKRYNLWKVLLNFYLKNNTFSLMLQNLSSSYVNNVVSSELPENSTPFVDVIHICSDLIKNSFERGYFKQTVVKSLRILRLVLLENFWNVGRSSTNVISRIFNSCLSHIQHILATSNDSTIICSSLKVHVLVRTLLVNFQESCVFDSSKYLCLSTHSISSQNTSKFSEYIPEILSMRLNYKNNAHQQHKLPVYSAYLQVSIIQNYLQRLDINVDFTKNSANFELDAETLSCLNALRDFVCIYTENKSNVIDSILKSIDSECMTQELIDFYITVFLTILKLNINSSPKHYIADLHSILLNIMHVVTNILSTKCDELSIPAGEFLRTSLTIALSTETHSLVSRLVAFKLCNVCIKHMKIFINNELKYIQNVVIESLRSEEWEIRDSSLELLNKILNASECNYVILDNDVLIEVLLRAQTDNESNIRTLLYIILNTSICMKHRLHKCSSYLDYDSIALTVCKQFMIETEVDVRVQMMKYLYSYWDLNQIIQDDLLLQIYNVVHYACCNDLSPYIRRKGIMFWTKLIELNNGLCENKEVHHWEILHRLEHIGCLMDIINGIEDEYDGEVNSKAISLCNCLKKSLKNNVGELEQFDSSGKKYKMDLLKLPVIECSDLKCVRLNSFVEKYFNQNLSVENTNNAASDEFDLKNFIECFADFNLESNIEQEVNQMDCY